MSPSEFNVVQDGEEIRLPGSLPLLPLRDVVVFPYMVTPLLVGRPASTVAVETAMDRDKLLCVVAQKQLPAAALPQHMVGVIDIMPGLIRACSAVSQKGHDHRLRRVLEAAHPGGGMLAAGAKHHLGDPPPRSLRGNPRGASVSAVVAAQWGVSRRCRRDVGPGLRPGGCRCFSPCVKIPSLLRCLRGCFSPKCKKNRQLWRVAILPSEQVPATSAGIDAAAPLQTLRNKRPGPISPLWPASCGRGRHRNCRCRR